MSFYSKLLLVLSCFSTMTSGVPVQLTAVPSLHTSVDVVQPSLSPTQQVAGWGTCSMTSRSGVSRSRSRELVSCRLSSKWKHKGQYWLWSGSRVVCCACRLRRPRRQFLRNYFSRDSWQRQLRMRKSLATASRSLSRPSTSAAAASSISSPS